MIKYVEYDAFDEHGQHIVPINNLYQMNKTASGTYSPELMKIILNMKRRQDRYYVVVNALGSHEVWGCNRNGDSFPEVGLTHKSLRTDMGTPNDYGYKTFEYYAKLYKHHVNKDPNNSFGEIIFSHWNPVIHRVELIIAIDVEKAKDIVDALDKQEQVSVSMGCKVKYDRCSICDNKSATREKYCKHLTDHMRQIVSKDQAAQWSIETGRTIIPGMQVFAFNDYPRFFDLSRVYVGADRTSYVLGKAASKGHIFFSADIADAKGVTDSMFDKMAAVGKMGEIEKELGGAVSPSDIDDPDNTGDSDGIMVKSDEMSAIKKSLDEKMNKVIAVEPRIPNSLIDPMATTLPLETIFSTLFGLGIHPKPEEFQRIVLIKIKQKALADELDSQNLVFDHNNNDIEPMPINISENDFSDTLGRGLASILPDRSCFPSMLGPRMRVVIIKTAGFDILKSQEARSPKIDPGLTMLTGLAALYAGLKLKAMGYGPKELASIFANKSWLIPLVGGSVMWKIYDEIDKKNTKEQMVPARDYANILQNTNFSGHLKQASINMPSLANATGAGLLASAITLPSAYIANAWNRKSLQTTGRQLFPGAGVNPIAAAVVGGVGVGGLSYASRYGLKGLVDSGKGARDAISRGITKVLKK
jgi:hypothetical protein